MVKTTGTANHNDLEEIKNIDDVFVFQRGDIKTNQGLRFRVKVPEGLKGRNKQQLTVSNIYDTDMNQHIRYGGQIADYVTMSVTASVIPNGGKAAAIPCRGATVAAASAGEGANGGPNIISQLAKESGRGCKSYTGDACQD